MCNSNTQQTTVFTDIQNANLSLSQAQAVLSLMSYCYLETGSIAINTENQAELIFTLESLLNNVKTHTLEAENKAFTLEQKAVNNGK